MAAAQHPHLDPTSHKCKRPLTQALTTPPFRSQVAKEHPAVSIGSYPNTGSGAAGDAYKVKLAFHSRDAAALSVALEAAKAALPNSFEMV